MRERAGARSKIKNFEKKSNNKIVSAFSIIDDHGINLPYFRLEIVGNSIKG
jgi:hypothetical protein